jgi:hypothetical protein
MQKAEGSPHDIGGSMVLAENFSKATVRGVASFGHTERQVHQSSCRDRPRPPYIFAFCLANTVTGGAIGAGGQESSRMD